MLISAWLFCEFLSHYNIILDFYRFNCRQTDMAKRHSDLAEVLVFINFVKLLKISHLEGRRDTESPY